MITNTEILIEIDKIFNDAGTAPGALDEIALKISRLQRKYGAADVQNALITNFWIAKASLKAAQMKVDVLLQASESEASDG